MPMLFVHTTVSPAAMVMLSGLNAMSSIEIWCVDASPSPTEGVDGPPPPAAALTSTVPVMKGMYLAMVGDSPRLTEGMRERFVRSNFAAVELPGISGGRVSGLHLVRPLNCVA